METTASLGPAVTLADRILKGRWVGKILLGLLLLAVVWIIGREALTAPHVLIQQVINGIQVGFVYALIALGYTMVYGIVRLINFAHGDVFMVGSFVSFFAISRWRLNLWLSNVAPDVPPWIALLVGTITVILLAMAACAILAVTIERVAYKPLRAAPRISALITAIGVSFFLEYFGALPFVFSPNFITYQRPFPVVVWYVKNGIHLLGKGEQAPAGSFTFSNILVIIVLTSILLVFLLQFIVRRTRIGKAMRAVSYDKPTARLMGINVDGVISVTFAIGAALAGAAGVLYAIAFPSIFFGMGITPGLKAFVAAVLGGIGSIPGAFVGALIMGQAEVLSAGYISTPMRDAVAFTLLILVLLIRPTGLFGEVEREKA
ncbi:MAG: branched-chain amino acid ABC transporter permease [Actinobacteria bacterium]|nr:branched-chain amino acid ABC transporter permease [Actinomycetota bacterium]